MGSTLQTAAHAASRQAEGQRAAVLLPLPLDSAYDYVLPPGVIAKRGLVVRAPLGSREVTGVVWGDARGGVAQERLRLADPLPDARIPEALCDFVDWVSQYTLSAPGAVLGQVLRASLLKGDAERKGLVAGTCLTSPVRQS